MVKRKRTKRLDRKLKNEQQEYQGKPGVNSGALEGQVVTSPPLAPVMLLVKNLMVSYIL